MTLLRGMIEAFLDENHTGWNIYNVNRSGTNFLIQDIPYNETIYRPSHHIYVDLRAKNVRIVNKNATFSHHASYSPFTLLQQIHELIGIIKVKREEELTNLCARLRQRLGDGGYYNWRLTRHGNVILVGRFDYRSCIKVDILNQTVELLSHQGESTYKSEYNAGTVLTCVTRFILDIEKAERRR